MADFGSVPAWGAVGVSLIVAVVSWIQAAGAKKSARISKEVAERAAIAAEKSAKAAEDSSSHSKRSADAAEQSVAIQGAAEERSRTEFEQRNEHVDVVWTSGWSEDGRSWRIWNVGRTEARDVRAVLTLDQGTGIVASRAVVTPNTYLEFDVSRHEANLNQMRKAIVEQRKFDLLHMAELPDLVVSAEEIIEWSTPLGTRRRAVGPTKRIDFERKETPKTRWY